MYLVLVSDADFVEDRERELQQSARGLADERYRAMAVQQRAAREREELARRAQNARRMEQDRMNQLGREAAALDREAAKLRQTAEEAARAKQVLSGAAAAAEQAATKIQVSVGYSCYKQPRIQSFSAHEPNALRRRYAHDSRVALRRCHARMTLFAAD